MKYPITEMSDPFEGAEVGEYSFLAKTKDEAELFADFVVSKKGKPRLARYVGKAGRSNPGFYVFYKGYVEQSDWLKFKRDKKSTAMSLEVAKDPCWDGYEMIGMKKKGKKDVPNCVKASVEDLFHNRNFIDDKPAYKSREKIVKMSPAIFRKLAKPLALHQIQDDKISSIDYAVSNNVKLESIPILLFQMDGNGGAKITGHEGRHRSFYLEQMGHKYIPVRLIGNIRWSQQDDPDNFDYIEDWPTYLEAETTSTRVKFPVSREDSNKPYSATKVLSSKLTQALVAKLKQRASAGSVALDILLLTRLLEKAREGVKTDADLHLLLESIIAAQELNNGPLTMSNYDTIVTKHEKLKAENPSLTKSDL